MAWLGWASPATAITVSRSVTLPSDWVEDLRAGPGGAIDLVSYQPTEAGNVGVAQMRWPARGGLTRATVGTVPQQSYVTVPTVVATAGGGAVAAFETVLERKRRVLVSTFDGRGGAPRTQVVSPVERSAGQVTAFTGGGAVGVTFYARRRATERASRLMWALRPAGARRFLTARTLDAPSPRGRVT